MTRPSRALLSPPTVFSLSPAPFSLSPNSPSHLQERKLYRRRRCHRPHPPPLPIRRPVTKDIIYNGLRYIEECLSSDRCDITRLHASSSVQNGSRASMPKAGSRRPLIFDQSDNTCPRSLVRVYICMYAYLSAKIMPRSSLNVYN
ncbi:hypothetical protein BS78_01G229300 [Paspalum vaginatum]|nr:hypothetical protein BS78_01G229300 [Paspalum vaginatum]